MWDVAWLGFWNLGIFALSICVLAGCRSNREANYGLVNWSSHTLSLVLGDDCFNATSSFLPEMYRFGMSGACRFISGTAECHARTPPSLNLAHLVLEDLAALNSTSIPQSILDGCRIAIDKPIDHGVAERLGAALMGILIFCVFTNLISILVCAVASLFSALTFVVLALDALLVFTCLCLCIAVLNFEGGPYLSGVHGGDYSDREMMGLGLWFLLAIFVARLVSHPFLLLGAILVILPIALVFLLFLVRTRGFWMVVRAAGMDEGG